MRSYCSSEKGCKDIIKNKFILNKTQDSFGEINTKKTQETKKAFIYKPHYQRACCLFLAISMLIPINIASASFLTDLIGISDAESYGGQKQNEEFGTDFYYNSQNIPLLETTSLNPDIKSIENQTDFLIVKGEALTADEFIFGSGLESVSAGDTLVYEVQEGDTISQIAENYNISVNTIRWENNLTSNKINVGQKLNILPVTGVKHIVKKGDTLDKIAKKYDAELEDILVYNDILKDQKLKQGDKIIVPNGVIIAPVISKPSSTTQNKSTSISTSTAVAGYYLRPVSGKITSPYGPRKGSYHYGIDIGNKRGTPIVAAAGGTVTEVVNYCAEGKSSCGGRYGNYVKIIHPNGQTTIYAHLTKASVSVGQSVSQGSNIGTLGNTGRSTGPHLHFEIQKANGSTIRPSF